jgi:hypothetical protein
MAEPSMRRPVDCCCPNCGITHQIRMIYFASDIPKRFCPRCKKIAKRYNTDAAPPYNNSVKQGAI